MSFSELCQNTESEVWFDTAIANIASDLAYLVAKMNRKHKSLKEEVKKADQVVESLRQELIEAHEIIETLRDSLDKLQDQG